MKVRFKKILPGAKVPVYSSEFAAGADLCACVEESVTVKSGESVMLPTGIAVELPAGTVGLVFARSGLASKRSLAPANKVGVIDCDYRGEIKVALFNHGKCDQTVEPGERIAQPSSSRISPRNSRRRRSFRIPCAERAASARPEDNTV